MKSKRAAVGAQYRVLRDEWNHDFTVRTIYEIETT